MDITSEWKEYTGSDEQIAEIVNCKTDVLCRYSNGGERLKSSMFIGDWKHKYLTHYLICNPHPLADMIIRQAQTGQPVWIKFPYNNTIDVSSYEFIKHDLGYSYHVTTTPDWNIPNAEYSFTPFGD